MVFRELYDTNDRLVVKRLLDLLLRAFVNIYKTAIWIITRKISITFLHAFLILILTYFWLNQPVAHDSEEKLLTNFTLLKSYVLSSTNTIKYTEDIICINTSYSKLLVDEYNSFGFKRGEIAITDREELVHLFETISYYNNHNYILCDIMFDKVSHFDIQLENAFNKTKNIIVPQFLDNDSLVKPIFSVNSALVLYLSTVYSNQFSKFQIIWHDSLKSIPLIMYNEIENKNVIKKGWFYFDDGKLCFNSNFIDFKVKTIKLGERSSSMEFNSFEYDLYYYDLTQFINKVIKYSDEDEMRLFLKDKIILIGSFEKEDIHNTMFGSIPGILILYNSYLNIKEGLHIIPTSLIIILLVIYITLSYRIFYTLPGIKFKFLSKINKSTLWVLISTLLSYTVLFGILSIMTYLMFSIIINVYLIAFYFSLLELATNYIKNRKKVAVFE